MSSSQYKTVVQGEASESSSSEEEDLEETVTPVVRNVTPSVVVEGEASESDEEELDSTGMRIKHNLPPLTVNELPSESKDDIASLPTLSNRSGGRPKHDTVLNRKLWESNLSLCSNMNGVASQAYLSAAKEITNCGHQLSKSHAAIQDVSHNMRLLTNDLLNLDDRIDIITSCKLLPNIQLGDKNRLKESIGSGNSQSPVDTA